MQASCCRTFTCLDIVQVKGVGPGSALNSAAPSVSGRVILKVKLHAYRLQSGGTTAKLNQHALSTGLVYSLHEQCNSSLSYRAALYSNTDNIMADAHRLQPHMATHCVHGGGHDCSQLTQSCPVPGPHIMNQTVHVPYLYAICMVPCSLLIMPSRCKNENTTQHVWSVPGSTTTQRYLPKTAIAALELCWHRGRLELVLAEVCWRRRLLQHTYAVRLNQQQPRLPCVAVWSQHTACSCSMPCTCCRGSSSILKLCGTSTSAA